MAASSVFGPSAEYSRASLENCGRNVTAEDLRSREPAAYGLDAMSFARTSTCIVLAGLGLWLLIAAPVRASEADPVDPPGLGTQVDLLAASSGSSMGTGSIGTDCTFRGKKLYGKVKVVDSFPDIRVKAVSSFPDLKVKKVTSFANSCGEWQMVDSFPDVKIQFVDSFPDIEIAWVDSFPGLP
jgi:hypothetical protein